MTRRFLTIACLFVLAGADARGEVPPKRVYLESAGLRMDLAPLTGVTLQGLVDASEPQRSKTSQAMLPFIRATQVTWDIGLTPRGAQAYRLEDSRFTSCASVAIGQAGIKVNPSTIRCFSGGSINDGGRVIVDFESGHYLVLDIPNRKLPINGTDLGIGVTVMDRWRDPADEGFRLHEGVSAYYALSRLHSDEWRWISHVALLDDDPALDFEFGLGFGLLYQPKKLETDQGSGFGLAIGVGYNLMLDRGRERPYTFVGLSYNLDREKREQAAE